MNGSPDLQIDHKTEKKGVKGEVEEEEDLEEEEVEGEEVLTREEGTPQHMVAAIKVLTLNREGLIPNHRGAARVPGEVGSRGSVRGDLRENRETLRIEAEEGEDRISRIKGDKKYLG